MQTLTLTNENREEVIAAAAKVLRAGGVIMAPCDTVYGIMGNATDPESVRKIFVMKGRVEEKALPIFVRDIEMARKYATISDTKAKILEQVWPGPFTVVFHHKEKLPHILTGKFATIGIRIPKYPLIIDLLRAIDIPLAQSSANISGSAAAKTFEEAEAYTKKMSQTPDLLINGGDTSGHASAVIDFSSQYPIVLRTGLVTKSNLDKILHAMENM